MEAKERLLEDWKLIDVAETLYNFRNAMDIEGIKNTLWQLVKQQDNISFKVGIKEVVDTIRIYDKNYAQNDWGNSKFRESLLWWLKSKLQEWKQLRDKLELL